MIKVNSFFDGKYEILYHLFVLDDSMTPHPVPDKKSLYLAVGFRIRSVFCGNTYFIIGNKIDWPEIDVLDLSEYAKNYLDRVIKLKAFI